MKIPILIMILNVSFLIFVSCSSYVEKAYVYPDKSGYNRYNQIQKKEISRGIASRNSTSSNSSSRNNRTSRRKDFLPRTKMRYLKRNSSGLETKKVNDLRDNGNDGSLWKWRGQENYFFSRNNSKKNGDVVTIEIKKNLHNSILDEIHNHILKKSKGIRMKRYSLKREISSEKKPGNSSKIDEVYSKIPSIIVKNKEDGYLVVQGEKFFFYKNKKNLVRVKALVRKSDIDPRDIVDSDNILNINISVLR